MTRLKISKLPTTVIKNHPKELRDWYPVVAATFATRQNTPKGRHFIMSLVIVSIASKRP